ncbi:hypothetical protein SLA2020_379790 [Shorea laevis]
MAGSDPEKLISKADKLTKLSLTRWSADWKSATQLYEQAGRYTDAATFLLRWGLAADKCNATNSQCKAYLSSIIVYLYAHDFKQAEKCYNDCSQIDAFLRSDQGRCASRLLSAYSEGDIEEIKRLAQSSTVSNLDHVVRISIPLYPVVCSTLP